MKSYSDKAPDFHDEEIPKVGSYHTCLAIISLDSALKKMKTIICRSFKRLQIHGKRNI